MPALREILMQAGFLDHLTATLAQIDSDGLIKREREIASLIGEALCNKEIGRRLNIELPTVKAHVSRVLAKAEARSRAELIKKLQAQ